MHILQTKTIAAANHSARVVRLIQMLHSHSQMSRAPRCILFHQMLLRIGEHFKQSGVNFFFHGAKLREMM
jgi:hypothetical protein